MTAANERESGHLPPVLQRKDASQEGERPNGRTKRPTRSFVVLEAAPARRAILSRTWAAQHPPAASWAVSGGARRGVAIPLAAQNLKLFHRQARPKSLALVHSRPESLAPREIAQTTRVQLFGRAALARPLVGLDDGPTREREPLARVIDLSLMARGSSGPIGAQTPTRFACQRRSSARRRHERATFGIWARTTTINFVEQLIFVSIACHSLLPFCSTH